MTFRIRTGAHRPLALLCCLTLLLAAPGCYWRWSNAAGDPFPVPQQVETIPLTAGVTLSGLSNAPDASSIAPAAVSERFVERMVEEKIFQNVVYPLTPLAQVRVDVLFDVTVRIEEHQHWAENLIKAVLVGFSFFLLGPVLPSHFTVVVDLSAKAGAVQGAEIGTYRYRSEYDYHYTTMTPSGSKMEEWLTTAQKHAVEDVLLQIKRDRHRFLEAVPPPQSPSP